MNRWTQGGMDEDWVHPPDADPFRTADSGTAKRIVEGMNIIAVLDAVKLRAGLEALGRDQHQFGSRPCRTCEDISALMGQPFGCVVHRERREAARERGKASDGDN